ncbi:DUF6279 family lipoprotein [Bdellovibrio sp. ArHS]|uniref:DUF6279 family lipoprotein n=1 Tax=Bdellovibrio sp. ArHS TaxID=1569284 RepID=UPI000A5122C6|nr:DUF6279 family lipoprotein [Bdellovibrio sp. ArHS]
MKPIALLALCAFFASACARLDIAVNWADTFIAAKVDDYFDISSEQSKSLKKSLQSDFKKIKQDVLPQWIKSAKDLERDVASDSLSQEKIQRTFEMVTSSFEHFTAHFSRTAVDFIGTTKNDQWTYFAKAFNEKNEDDLKEISSSHYEKKQKKRYFKYFEMFLGDLTEEQTHLIEKHLRESPYPAELKIKNRKHIYQVFVEKRQHPDGLKEFVAKFSEKPESFNLPEYNQAVHTYQVNLKNLLTAVLKTLNKNQKRELCDNLLEKVAQLEKIRGRS